MAKGWCQRLYRGMVQPDYESMDMVPLIGKITDAPLYLATGFRKWGITSAFVASLIIRI